MRVFGAVIRIRLKELNTVERNSGTREGIVVNHRGTSGMQHARGNSLGTSRAFEGR